MPLITPIGSLADIDITSIEQLKAILVQDKTRMLEGLVIERVFQNYLGRLAGQGVVTLPLSLVKAKSRNIRQGAWWIWNHDNIGKDADALQAGLRACHGEGVIQCRYDPQQRDFLIKEWRGRHDLPLQSFMLRKRRLERPVFPAPDQSIKDRLRDEAAFWSGIFGQYGNRLFEDVVLHRLFKNCAVQPFFTYLWDFDNMARLLDGRMLQLEVKHKYPYQSAEGLMFGINRGQLRAMQDLARSGIDTLHMIMVKPRWIKDTGTGYLLQNIAERSRVLMIAHYLDYDSIQRALARETRPSSRQESWNGQHSIRHGAIPGHEFHLLGTLDDPVDRVAGNIQLATARRLHNPVSDQLLLANRILD